MHETEPSDIPAPVDLSDDSPPWVYHLRWALLCACLGVFLGWLYY